MGVLGKDLLDFDRPLTHTKVQFGEEKYWIEENSEGISYGTTLVELLNFNPEEYKAALAQFHESAEKKDHAAVVQTLFEVREQFLRLPFYRSYMKSLGVWDIYLFSPMYTSDLYEMLDELTFLYHTSEDIELIQERYIWFVENALDDKGERRKKGQRKLPAADRIYKNTMEPYVSGRSLGKSPEVDAPNVQLQYAVLETENGMEIVEKIYFDRLADFVYVELMKGLQKGFIPKRCPNCGKWFIQEPGMDFNYCANPAPQDPAKQCRDIGAANSFIDKKKNHTLWNIHQKAYRKYYARMKKGNMTKAAFFEWAEAAAQLRDELLPGYEYADSEKRAAMAEEYRLEVNKL